MYIPAYFLLAVSKAAIAVKPLSLLSILPPSTLRSGPNRFTMHSMPEIPQMKGSPDFSKSSNQPLYFPERKMSEWEGDTNHNKSIVKPDNWNSLTHMGLTCRICPVNINNYLLLYIYCKWSSMLSIITNYYSSCISEVLPHDHKKVQL